MNTVDMHSREKVNKIHLEEMHQEAKLRQLLHQANQETESKQPVHNPAVQIRTFFKQLSALLPHHVPHGHSVHHAK
jgi:hypothetical protein